MSPATHDPRSAALPPKEDPEALVLRAKPRPAVRLRRGLIVGISGTVALGLVSLSWFALEPSGFRKAADRAGIAEPAATPVEDSLADAPASYGDVPRLGPPLPGDLGRPILEHRRSLEGDAGASATDSSQVTVTERARAAAEAERERQMQAKRTARSSPVLVQLQDGGTGTASRAAERGNAKPVTSGGAVPSSQQRKPDFTQVAAGGGNRPTVRAAPSPWTLSAGTIIPASLITGINSDLPGIVLAQVTHDVRDSATGRIVLVPQGARLIGRYDDSVAYGQRRALLVWNRIVFPDGSSVELDDMPATDASGYAGVEDRVDSHSWQLLKGVALSTLLGVGTQLSLGSSESDLVRAIRESTQQNAAHAGDQVTTRNLSVQPTITVRPGWPVRAVVNRDLILQPWRG